MIALHRQQYNEIVEDAYRRAPEEACGLMGGTYDPERSIVESVHPARNIADTPEIRYYIDPEEQLALTEEIEGAGKDVVGFYHSHPAGASAPSDTDRQRATWPDQSYMIVSLDGYPFVGSWRWREKESAFEQEIVAIHP